MMFVYVVTARASAISAAIRISRSSWHSSPELFSESRVPGARDEAADAISRRLPKAIAPVAPATEAFFKNDRRSSPGCCFAGNVSVLAMALLMCILRDLDAGRMLAPRRVPFEAASAFFGAL